MAKHSSTLAWKIPWTEEAGRLQSMVWQTVRDDSDFNFHSIYSSQNEKINLKFITIHLGIFLHISSLSQALGTKPCE